jgi:uncharacterized membrane protein
MAEFISIRKMREIRDPELFVRCVINDKARLERLDEKRKERLEQAKREAEKQEQEKKAQEEFHAFVLKFAIGFSFFVAAAATYVALVF